MTLLKNEETNPICRTLPDRPTRSPATNKEKVIMFFGGAGIPMTNPFPPSSWRTHFVRGKLQPARA